MANAGHQHSRESINKVTSDGFDIAMKTNLYAMHCVTQEAVPHLPPGAAILACTKALSKQLLEKGIRANVVARGPFWTARQAGGGQPPEKVEPFGAQVA